MATARQLLRTFDDELSKSVALVDAIRELRYPPASGRRFRALPNFQVALVAELSFLRCFLSWEVFLEETFMSYVQGGSAPDGTRYASFIAAPTASHARKMIRGERRAFVGWANPKEVLTRANLLLANGDPFETAIATVSTPLNDMVTVRNRIAHRSGSASDRFLELVRRRHGSVQPGMSPGRYLLGPGLSPGQRQLDEYVTLLRAAARIIAP